MTRTISEEDLIAKDAVYHSSCFSSYLSKTNLKAKAPSSTVTTQCPYDTAFYSLILNIVSMGSRTTWAQRIQSSETQRETVV